MCWKEKIEVFGRPEASQDPGARGAKVADVDKGGTRNLGGRGRCAKPTLAARFKNEFLDAPIQKFGDVEFVRGGTSHFVDPAELAKLFAGFAEHTENFSVEAEFVDAAGESVGGAENLVRSRRGAASARGARSAC